MSRLPTASVQTDRTAPPTDRYTPAHRPTWFDFLCILIGFTLSLVLADWSGFAAQGTDATPAPIKDSLLTMLPRLLFMPLGLMLFWPVFFLTQWLRGREEPMSSGEWLWGLAWAGTFALGRHSIRSASASGTLPEMLEPAALKRWIFVGYAVGTLALVSLAALLTLIGLIGRWRYPWTHSFCLVLLIWPAIWLASCLAWGIEIK